MSGPADGLHTDKQSDHLYFLKEAAAVGCNISGRQVSIACLKTISYQKFVRPKGAGVSTVPFK